MIRNNYKIIETENTKNNCKNKSLEGIRRNVRNYDNLESSINFLEGNGGGSWFRKRRANKKYNIIRQFFQCANISSNSNVLDIGCSGGRYIRLLLKNNLKPYWIDTSIIALKHARSISNQNAVFIKASATELPFRKNVFDVVLCIELLHHFDEYYIEKLFKDITSLIKPGGTFICDFRNSLNPIMSYIYRKNNGKHFTLNTISIFKMIKILKKYDFTIYKKESILFPNSLFSPYFIFFCKYDKK